MTINTNKSTAVINILAPHVKYIHPVVDFTADGMVLGFQRQEQTANGAVVSMIFITETEDTVAAQIVDDRLNIGENTYHITPGTQVPELDEKWDPEDLTDYLNNPQPPEDILETLKNVIGKFVGFAAPGLYGLTAAWVLATYFAYLFAAFPFIFCFGPKNSGKSKLLELLSLVVFNGVKASKMTTAALTTLTDGLRSTIFWDQAESLPGDMIGLLADSYKMMGATRFIYEKKKGERRALRFSGYGPKAFGSTKALDTDLIDRCIQINMQRTNQPFPDILGSEPEIRKCRHLCYRFLLTKWRDVRDIYASIPSTGTRQNEMWRPLESVLRAAGTCETEISVIKNFFDIATSKTKAALTLAEEALFQVLYDRSLAATGVAEFVMTPDEILTEMEKILHKKHVPISQQLGKIINKFNLASSNKPRTRFKITHYKFNVDHVRNVASVYAETLDVSQPVTLIKLVTNQKNEKKESAACQPKRLIQWV